MPLPLILGIGAAVAGAAGLGSGIHGAVKLKDANDTMKSAQSLNERLTRKFENQTKQTNSDMDSVGNLELTILSKFDEFSDLIEMIHNRPEFKEINKDGVKLPGYDPEELKKASVGAGVLLGGLGGAAVGTAGGFAAAGATTSAVMALGTASTGTAIASLSGAAATNATLAALGGGAIAAGGGGIALGTAVLGAATAGVGLLIGGVIFNATGSKLSDKADEAWSQVKKNEAQVNKICDYLEQLSIAAKEYVACLERVNEIYQLNFNKLYDIVIVNGKTDWNAFSNSERRITQNTVDLVGLLHKMCEVKLVLKSESDSEMNEVNYSDIDNTIRDANTVLANVS